MGRTVLVSYAGAHADAALDASLRQAQGIQIASIGAGGIDSAVAWNRAKLQATRFYREHRDILDTPRGDGYWLWKPYIILQALRSVGNDDVVIYSDVGRVKPYAFTRAVAPLVQWCRRHNGILPGVPVLPQAHWTKRDCFHFMGCDTPQFWKATQIQATFSLWSGPAAMEFVSQWLKWCTDRRCLSDDPNTCGLVNLPGFVEHRHDQSVLTNLCVKLRVATPVAPPIPPGVWSKNINLWSELVESRFQRTAIPASDEQANQPNQPNQPQTRRFVQAERTWKVILNHAPGQPFALHRLGLVYLRTNRPREGLELLRQAASALPQLPDVQCDLAAALQQSGFLRQASQAFEKATSLPHVRDETAVFVKIGDISAQLGDAARAEVAYRQALMDDAHHVPAWERLAGLLLAQARHPEAIDALRRACELRRDDAKVQSSLLRAMHRAPGCTDEAILDEHRAWMRRHAAPGTPIQPFRNERSAGRKLRIGYIASAFHSRSVAAFVEPLIACHDRGAGAFEIFCYDSAQTQDGASASLQARVDAWRELDGDSDRSAAIVREDRIDILVDLTAHGAGSVLAVLGRRPAPVQIAWLGDPSVIGPQIVDYRLSDAYLDPPAAAGFSSSQKLLRLPHTFACYAPPERAPSPARSPGGHTRLVTFGCLADPTAITRDMLRLWCRILRGVPDSRLLLRFDFDPPVLRETLADEGVDPARVETVRRFSSRQAYLQALNWVDVVLDTFPHNAHIAGCDALWMGAAMITLAASRPDSRIGMSLLSNLRLTELIAHDADEYVDKAIALGRDRNRMRELRRSLRERMRASPLTAAAEFARDVEAIYREVWQQWCRSGRPAAAIA